MASTKQLDLNSQSSLSGLLSENETQSAITMAFPKNETPRFESFPPEIRNIVYRHLFPPLRKGYRPRKMESKWLGMWSILKAYTCRDAYIYDTAILRSNRLIGQEAKTVLYGGNIFVLFNFTDNGSAYLMVSNLLKNIAWNPVRIGAPAPSCVVQFNHGRQDGKPAGPSLIVAAADVNLICKRETDLNFCRHRPSAAYSLVALPQLGLQHERLLKMIWLPLKALRESRRIYFEENSDGLFISDTMITDCTGVFEKADEMYKPKDSESGSLSEPSRENDTEKDESDGIGSEGSKNGDHDSCDEEEEEQDDSEDMDRTSNDRDDVAHEESEDDEANTSGESSEGDSDEAATFKSHEHCNNNPRAKPIPCKASISSPDADANAQNTIFDNNATQG